jgi:hypothetical protein
MSALGTRNRWGVIVPRSVAWSRANGVSDGREFFCRGCCELAIADQYMPDIEGRDIVENWLSNMRDEGYIATLVAGVECNSCEKVAN